MTPCTYPTLIVGRFPTFTLPVTTSSAVIFSNLQNTFAPTLTNCHYSTSEPKPHPTSHLTFTLPMTTHTPPTTNAIASLAFPSRSWVMKSTPSYTAPPLSQVCQSPFDEERMLLCDICNAGWHMACLPTPTTIPIGMWKCFLCTPAAPSSQVPLRHLRSVSPILDPDSD